MNGEEGTRSLDIRVGWVKPIGQSWRTVQYAAVNGLAMMEGCVILGKVEDIEATSAKIKADPTLIQAGTTPLGSGIVGEQYRWPDKTIPYEIVADLLDPARVTNAIAHWESKTDFKFLKRTNQPNFIRFIPGGGCASHVGMQGGRQDIVVGPSCQLGNIIHEIGHAVGLWHEQSRSDRDEHIQVVWANISSEHRHNFEQHIVDGTDLGQYDYGSIMHYPRKAFSKNGQDTVIPKNGAVIGQRNGLSAGDTAAVAKLYA